MCRTHAGMAPQDVTHLQMPTQTADGFPVWVLLD